MTPMALPIRPIEGYGLRLQPYEDALKAELGAALDCDPDAWALFAISGAAPEFESWWSGAMTQMAAGLCIPYAVRRAADGALVGTTRFMDIRAANRGVEIGGTFLRPEARSGIANPAAKRMMLDFAFAHGAMRVELVTDARNLRSQAAIAKLGAMREGVLRKERVTWTGHVRDSVLYSITDDEWPAVKDRLDQRLAALV